MVENPLWVKGKTPSEYAIDLFFLARTRQEFMDDQELMEELKRIADACFQEGYATGQWN